MESIWLSLDSESDSDPDPDLEAGDDKPDPSVEPPSLFDMYGLYIPIGQCRVFFSLEMLSDKFIQEIVDPVHVRIFVHDMSNGLNQVLNGLLVLRHLRVEALGLGLALDRTNAKTIQPATELLHGCSRRGGVAF